MKGEMPTVHPEGKKILHAYVEDNRLCLDIEGGPDIAFSDLASYCCEHRYMNCDDDLKAFAGAVYLGYELRDGPTAHEGNDHLGTDCQFLIIRTSEGDFTIANYNEHNGYYGGFDLSVEVKS